jgi:hypothetical protein
LPSRNLRQYRVGNGADQIGRDLDNVQMADNLAGTQCRGRTLKRSCRRTPGTGADTWAKRAWRSRGTSSSIYSPCRFFADTCSTANTGSGVQLTSTRSRLATRSIRCRKNCKQAANASHLRFGRARGGFIPGAGTTASKKPPSLWSIPGDSPAFLSEDRQTPGDWHVQRKGPGRPRALSPGKQDALIFGVVWLVIAAVSAAVIFLGPS